MTPDCGTPFDGARKWKIQPPRPLPMIEEIARNKSLWSRAKRKDVASSLTWDKRKISPSNVHDRNLAILKENSMIQTKILTAGTPKGRRA
jgi:hypothetical protein